MLSLVNGDSVSPFQAPPEPDPPCPLRYGPDRVGCTVVTGEMRDNLGNRILRADDGKADAHVEGAKHFCIGNVAFLTDHSEDIENALTCMDATHNPGRRAIALAMRFRLATAAEIGYY